MAVWTLEVKKEGDGLSLVYRNRATSKVFHCGDVTLDTPRALLFEWMSREALPFDLVRLEDGSEFVKLPERGVRG